VQNDKENAGSGRKTCVEDITRLSKHRWKDYV